MDFGTATSNKFDYGRVLAAVLAHLMVRQHDAPGLVLFSDDAIEVVPAQGGRFRAEEIFFKLRDTHALGRTALSQNLRTLVQGLTRRGFAIVISDFFSPDDMTIELLRQLHAQNQEIIVFHLLSPEELDLPFEGEVVMQDSETAEELPVDVGFVVWLSDGTRSIPAGRLALKAHGSTRGMGLAVDQIKELKRAIEGAQPLKQAKAAKAVSYKKAGRKLRATR